MIKITIIDIIRSRHSVRTYKEEKLTKELTSQLGEYMSSIEGPFDADIRLVLVDEFDIAQKTGGKIGTYGVIKGASTYAAGVIQEGDKNLLQLGYCMERFILYATSLELGTCWLGGTFKRSEFASIVNLQANETIPIVTPVGYINNKKSIVDSLMRAAAGSNNRKPWNELFFDCSFEKSLSQESAGRYAEALEMVRLAPSASNKQPWRIVKDGNSYHFYLKSAKGYGKALGFNIQKVDMGIAMCHFEMTLQEQGIPGKWVINEKAPEITRPEGTEYTVSWIEA